MTCQEGKGREAEHREAERGRRKGKVDREGTARER